MPDDPITFATLMQYHREVLLPDMQRLISESERRLLGAMDAGFDALHRRLDRLATESYRPSGGAEETDKTTAR